jgi:endogenous inhibitor of DNA gyrase (YacG/DUF329 family)
MLELAKLAMGSADEQQLCHVLDSEDQRLQSDQSSHPPHCSSRCDDPDRSRHASGKRLTSIRRRSPCEKHLGDGRANPLKFPLCRVEILQQDKQRQGDR